jgi:hypothetical protein
MRLAGPAAILGLALLALSGCGSSGDDTGSTTGGSQPATAAPPGATARACVLDAGSVSSLRAAHVSCGAAQKVAVAWTKAAACKPPAGASRAGCTVSPYRCVAAATDRGWSVSCARPGRAVAFTAKR